MSYTSIDRLNPLGLPLWDTPWPEEPAHGLLLRLSDLNGYRRLSSVLRETGLCVSKLHHGQQFEALGQLVGCSVAEIGRDSFRIEDDTYVHIRNEKIGYYRDFDCTRRRACPECLRESVYHRFWWDLTFFDSCPKHGIKLIDRCSCQTPHALSWVEGRLLRGRCCTSGDLRDVVSERAHSTVLAMDRYMAGRLGLGPRRAVAALDELSLYDAIDLLDRIGALHAGGWSKLWRRSEKVGLSPADNRAAAYEILVEERLQDVLERVYQGYLASKPARAPAMTTAYGWFFHWYNLKGNRRFSTYLTEQLYRHAASRFHVHCKALQARGHLLSVETQAVIGQSRTLRSAAKAFGCSPEKIRRVAEAYGLVRREKLRGQQIELKAADVEVLAWLVRRVMTKEQVAAKLGVGENLIHSLIAGNLLLPVLHGGACRPEIYWFLKDDVDALLGRLEAKCKRGPAMEANRALDKPRGVKVADVCIAILDHEIEMLWLDPNATGLSRIRVRSIDLTAVRRQRKEKADLRAQAEHERPNFEHWRTRMREVLDDTVVEKAAVC